MKTTRPLSIFTHYNFQFLNLNSQFPLKMIDALTPEKRSWNMSQIKSGNTKPELIVRSLLHSMGYRFRLHGRVNKRLFKKGVLPGKPDIVLRKYKTVIFVHGCFWHRHKGCPRATTPKTNTDFWLKKFEANTVRDKKAQSSLRAMGWKVIVIWECELKDLNKLSSKIRVKIKE